MSDTQLYEKIFEVRFNDTGRHSLITPVALFGFLQETAICHAESRGFSGEFLAQHQWTWVLNRVHVRFEHYPRWREQVAVTTWPSNLAGLYATREFLIADGSWNSCGCGTSRWVLVDVARKRAIRIPPVISEGFDIDTSRAIDDAFPREREVEGEGITKEFHVRLSDLDTNQHANSGSYFDWFLETVPMDVLMKCVPREVEITYKRESVLGDTLRVKSVEGEATAEGGRSFCHAIVQAGRDGVVAIGKSVWGAEV